MMYPWLRAIPLATMLACLPALATAQAMSGIGLDGLAIEGVTPVTAASPASAPTFTQLSRPATSGGTATAGLAPAAEEKEHEYLTLALAGLAALAFVSRRQRRAASQPASAKPA